MQTSVGVGGPVGSVRPLAKKLYGAPYVFYRRRFLLDAVSWWVAVIVATLIRYEGMLDRANWRSVVYTMLLASILQLIFGYILGVYRGRHTLGSFEGFIDVSATTILTTLWVWIYTVLWPNFAGVPRSLILIAAPIAIVLMAGTRYVARLMVQRKVRPAKAQAPVILYGAGYVGDHLARLLTTDTNSHVTPVGILDDDPGKRNLRLHGVRVVGSRQLPNRFCGGFNHGHRFRIVVHVGQGPIKIERQQRPIQVVFQLFWEFLPHSSMCFPTKRAHASTLPRSPN